MTTRTCLRCDWQGEMTGSKCPNCDAPLYELGKQPPGGAGVAEKGHPEERSREAASTAIVAPSATPPRPSTPPPRAPEAATAEPTSTRSRSLVALILTVIVLAVAVGSWLNAHTEPGADPAIQEIRPTSLTGTLVYAVPDGPDRSRLWRWDLATGRVARGPRVPRAIELVDARGANFGWVGVTSELPDGRLRASLLRFFGPDDRAVPILEGDVVSWGPQGASVIAARRGPLRSGCRRSVSIIWARLVPALREQKYADPALCGDLLSIGLDNASTMFTLDRGGRIGIFFAGIGRIHRVLPGYAMVAISGLSDIIVVPQDALATLTPLPARPEQEHADLLGAGLYFQGLGEPRPLPYGGVGGVPFSVARMLAWNTNEASALVVGRQGFRRGFYLLDTASGDGVETPRYIGPASGIPYGTFALGDTVFVETADGLFATVAGELVRLRPPADAPAPDGPIVWIR
jgi:hypothetical protein